MARKLLWNTYSVVQRHDRVGSAKAVGAAWRYHG